MCHQMATSEIRKFQARFVQIFTKLLDLWQNVGEIFPVILISLLYIWLRCINIMGHKLRSQSWFLGLFMVSRTPDNEKFRA